MADKDKIEATMALLETIKAHYNESELQLLCLQLGVNYEDLVGGSRVDKIRELVLYCQRHSLTAKLQATVMARTSDGPVPKVNVTDLDTWVAALERSPTIQNGVTRQALLAELPDPIRNSLNSHLPTLTAQLRDLIRTCQNYQDGLSSLVRAIQILEGNSLAVQNLESLL